MTDRTLTQKRLKEVLHYSPDTGIFTWRISHKRVQAGNIAGYIDGNGYRLITFEGLKRKASWFAVLYMSGKWPTDQVDHDNRVRGDDSWVNLALVTQGKNLKNRAKFKNNTSGFTGLYWIEKRKVWRVLLCANYVKYNLGEYEEFWDALCARKSAEYKHGFHENHGT